MILFWIVAALLTVGMVLLLAGPLMRASPDIESPGGTDLAVYRDQLSELERDKTRGLIEPDQAAAMETEIGRRMLGAARATEAAPRLTAPARRLTLLVAALFPIGGLLIYLAVGHPDLPGMPLAGRQISPESDPAVLLAKVEQMKSQLKPVKEDLPKWLAVGEAYAQLDHPREAVDALRVAAGLAPDNAAISAVLAESLIAADGGAVGEEAKQRLAAIPETSTARPEARYYLALADQQAGDTKTALAEWKSLLAQSPADAPWVEVTKSQIAKAAKSLGLDPVQETPATLPAKPGPTDADIDAASKMTPEQQVEMIRGMVDRLAAKLEANPDNPQGWQELARAYQVIGEPEKAKAAEGRAAAAQAKAGKP